MYSSNNSNNKHKRQSTETTKQFMREFGLGDILEDTAAKEYSFFSPLRVN